jgi:1-acyl-sn-glycerol-3-phosphate acyltransferase
LPPAATASQHQISERMSDLLEHKTQFGRKTRLAQVLYSFGGERLAFALGRFLYRLKVSGQENIPLEEPCLFAFNHVSMIADSFVQLVIRKRRPDVYLFGVQELRGNNPVAQAFESLGDEDALGRLLMAYKARGLSAAELLRARNLLSEGAGIALAAEGEMTWDGRLQHPLAPGTAWLALRSAVPVVPVISTGGYDIQPRWQAQKIRLTGRIAIRVGEPIQVCAAPIKRLKMDELNQASDKIWSAMSRLQQMDGSPVV